MPGFAGPSGAGPVRRRQDVRPAWAPTSPVEPPSSPSGPASVPEPAGAVWSLRPRRPSPSSPWRRRPPIVLAVGQDRTCAPAGPDAGGCLVGEGGASHPSSSAPWSVRGSWSQWTPQPIPSSSSKNRTASPPLKAAGRRQRLTGARKRVLDDRPREVRLAPRRRVLGAAGIAESTDKCHGQLRRHVVGAEGGEQRRHTGPASRRREVVDQEAIEVIGDLGNVEVQQVAVGDARPTDGWSVGRGEKVSPGGGAVAHGAGAIVDQCWPDLLRARIAAPQRACRRRHRFRARRGSPCRILPVRCAATSAER